MLTSLEIGRGPATSLFYSQTPQPLADTIVATIICIDSQEQTTADHKGRRSVNSAFDCGFLMCIGIPAQSHPQLSGAALCPLVRRLLVSLALTIQIAWAAPTFGQSWVVHQKTERLDVFSEFDIDVPALTRQLDSVRDELRRILELPDGGKNVQLILFKSPSSYRGYLSSRIPEGLKRRAIFYKRGDLLQIYAYRHAEFSTDLRHEYTHALLHQTLPYVPLWIDEGLAEFMEELPHSRKRSSRLAGMKWRCRSGWQPSLKGLEQIPTASGMTAAHYRDSWAWVHYLINDSDVTRLMLRDYLLAISAGEAPGAFSEWAGQHDTEVVKRVGSYFRRFRISLR